MFLQSNQFFSECSKINEAWVVHKAKVLQKTVCDGERSVMHLKLVVITDITTTYPLSCAGNHITTKDYAHSPQSVPRNTSPTLARNGKYFLRI